MMRNRFFEEFEAIQGRPRSQGRDSQSEPGAGIPLPDMARELNIEAFRSLNSRTIRCSRIGSREFRHHIASRTRCGASSRPDGDCVVVLRFHHRAAPKGYARP